MLFLLANLAIASATVSKIGLKQLESGARMFIEEDTGRTVIFHGVNAVVKGFPYVPATDAFDIDTSLNEKDHEILADLGVNIYRLGSMWPGAEPTKGSFNSTYVNQLKGIVKLAEKHGIYTILDMHQDVLSEKYCGEGIPAWAANLGVNADGTEKLPTFPAPQEAPYVDVATDGFPTRADCAKYNWPTYYNTYDAGAAFNSLYTNVSGLLDSWGNFWVYMAEEIGTKQNAVVAYELINEPWAGDALNDLKLFVPTVADKQLLQPAYDELARRIRAVDNQTLIMFAAVTWDDVVPCGFTHAPGGAEYSDKSIFAYHYYDLPQFFPKIYFHQRNADAERLQVGQMLTEFERSDSSSEVTNKTDRFVEIADYADKYQLSWANWEYKTFCKETPESLASNSQQAAFGSCKTGYGGHNWLFNDDGSIIPSTAQKLARTYARYTSGTIKSMVFDSSTAEFTLAYAINTDIAEPTVIYANTQYNYPNGIKVEVSPPLALKHVHTGNYLEFLPSEHVFNGDEIRIHLTAL